MLNKLAFQLATGFGLGSLPAPGTMGSIAALLLWWLGVQFLSLWGQLLFILISVFVGYFIIKKAIIQLAQDDPKQVIWDEFIGMWITLLFVAPIAGNNELLVLILAFAFFRFFDILKPFPISWCDTHIKNAMGVIIDDVVAGIFAGSCLLLVFLFMV